MLELDTMSIFTIVDKEIIKDKSQYYLPQELPNEMKFGIVKINTTTPPEIHKKLFFLFSVDCSGSMSDICNDRRTKNAHIIHTLTNMLLFFSEKENIYIYVQIDAFDDKIWSIIKPVLISPNNVHELIKQLTKIYPRNTTNIELALIHAKEQIDLFTANDINDDMTLLTLDKYHIFMTDGDITQGNTCEIYLKTLLNLTATNIFIGFGSEHNIKVLSELGSGNDENSNVNHYYFIDVLENSGLVYGEIIHNILYGVLKNVELFIYNGLFYNWKTNLWTTTLNIGNVIYETEKVYHIVCFDNPTIISTNTNYCSNYNFDSLSESITKYKYRQRTQQLLFEARHFGERNDEESMKNKLYNFFKELQSCNIDDKPFIKLLTDDIYVTYKTFGTKDGAMYSGARQTSQGIQRCYNVGQPVSNIWQISRQIGNGSTINTNLNPNIRWTQQYDDGDAEYKYDVDTIEYELSQNTDTPYSNPALLGIMRGISDTTQLNSHHFFSDNNEYYLNTNTTQPL